MVDAHIITHGYKNAIHFRKKARHCEEGEARRGNPVTFLTMCRGCCPLFTGFPRQCAHWLGMTCCFDTQKGRLAPSSVGGIFRCVVLDGLEAFIAEHMLNFACIL